MAPARPTSGRLVLIPWHIGNRDDVTVRALREVERIRVLLVEDVELTRRQLAGEHRLDCTNKVFHRIDFQRDQELLKQCRDLLAREDVGLLSSSGTPCIIDPGAWLVRQLRGLGVPVVALAGASALATIMSLSGEEWAIEQQGFTFRLLSRGQVEPVDELIRSRLWEPIVLFLAPADGPALIARVEALDPTRIISFFFDITKEGMAMADRVESASAKAWAVKAGEIAWSQVSDLAAVLHAPPRPPPPRSALER